MCEVACMKETQEVKYVVSSNTSTSVGETTLIRSIIRNYQVTNFWNNSTTKVKGISDSWKTEISKGKRCILGEWLVFADREVSTYKDFKHFGMENVYWWIIINEFRIGIGEECVSDTGLVWWGIAVGFKGWE